MKIKLILALVATTAIAAAADTSKLISALIQVESRGNAAAIGDSGKALGILQIHATMVADANRIAGTHFTHREMLDPVKARAVATIVLSHYSARISKTKGRDATNKELAFIWNGGAGAWNRASAPINDTKQRNLESYWNKVAKAL
jgi:soluble lytic murein transglycosylase-like protein